MTHRWLWAVFVLQAGTALAAAPVDLRRAGRIDGNAQAGAAKVAVCVACHGPEGNAVVPAFPALAGQKAEYLYQSLAGFRRRADPASPMTAQVEKLTDADLRDVAAYFSTRPRKPATATAAAPAEPGVNRLDGAALFAAGSPARGIPPCQGCHGVAAQGHPRAADGAPRFAYYPALAGQNAEYVVARLGRYREGRLDDTTNARVMRGVAQTLDDASIRALADYLAGVPR